MCCFGNRDGNGRLTWLGLWHSAGKLQYEGCIDESANYVICLPVLVMGQCRGMCCFGNRENTNQMTALAMVMVRVKGG